MIWQNCVEVGEGRRVWQTSWYDLGMGVTWLQAQAWDSSDTCRCRTCLYTWQNEVHAALSHALQALRMNPILPHAGKSAPPLFHVHGLPIGGVCIKHSQGLQDNTMWGKRCMRQMDLWSCSFPYVFFLWVRFSANQWLILFHKFSYQCRCQRACCNASSQPHACSVKCGECWLYFRCGWCTE